MVVGLVAITDEVVASLVANRAHPEHPRFEDVGEALVCAGDVSGHVRVDWFTPEGLGSWGDVRLFVSGSEESCIKPNFLLTPAADQLYELLLFDFRKYIEVQQAIIKRGR